MPFTVLSAMKALTQAVVGTVDPVKARAKAREAVKGEEVIVFVDEVGEGGIASLRMTVQHS